MNRAVPLLLTLLVLTAPAAAIPIADTADTAETATLERTLTVSLTPETPGEIAVEARIQLPSGVQEFTLRLPGEATVTATDGFERRTAQRYAWTGRSRTPTLTYTLPANRTSSGERSGARGGGYRYVDTGDWAIVPVPRVGIAYSGTGDEPTLDSRVVVTGEGVVGEDLVFLGAHTVRNRTASGQTLRLVVPDAADLAESPSDILDAIERAAALDIGPRDDRVTVIAAPTSVAWGSTGLQRGDADFWAVADRRLDAPNNVWVHEYVHTRQTYRADDSARWVTEATADYYAALLTYRAGEIDYEQFRRHLELGQRARYENVVLAEPSTWGTILAPYDKGALVVGALDYRLRQRGSSYDALLRRYNGRNVTNADLVDAAGGLGGDDLAAFLREHTTTSATPETWTREAHLAAFGSNPEFAYAFQPPYERAGPYRNDTGTTAVTGETLTLAVRVENTGTEAGQFRAVLRRDGTRVANETGLLEAGAARTLTFPQTFGSAGEYGFSVGKATETVDVRFPASPRVVAVEAPARVAPDESFVVRTTVAAPDRPADGSVPVSVDGTPVADHRVQLDAGATREIETRLRLTEPGKHEITAREETVTVVVRSRATGTPTAGDEAETGTPGTQPATPTAGDGGGLGVLAAVSALAALAAATGARRWRARR
ncbi:hypothetical protein [Natronomonas sp. EA1]|uniref:hypothetical protein n=1 Tax=Natronomonas sp. EA1 TaxID=3421655 RepID=UPI003EC07DE6